MQQELPEYSGKEDVNKRLRKFVLGSGIKPETEVGDRCGLPGLPRINKGKNPRCGGMKSMSVTHWYAFKVFFNKVFDIEDFLRKEGVESYIPCETTLVIRRGVKKKVCQPVISSLMFFRSTPKKAMELQQQLNNRVILYTKKKDLRKLPMAIPEQEMNIFMLVTSSGEKGIEYLGDDHVEYHKGERLRVTDGIFKGAEGYIHRIKGNRRLVIAIEGVCAVALSYIPGCFLKKIEDEKQ